MRTWPLRPLLWAALVLAPLACSQSQALTTVVTVSPDAGGEGIEQALLTLRETRQRAGGSLSAPLRIVLKPGQYVLTRPIKIMPADSGTPDAPLIIEASQAGRAELVGAPSLPLVRRDASTWHFKPHVTADRAAERSGGQLFVGRQRAHLAQQPNPGSHYFVARALPTESGLEASKEAFLAEPADAASLLRLLDADRDRAIVTVMQSWTSGDHRLAGLDARGVLRVAPAAKWPFMMFGHSQRYVLRNLPAALDAPGEWVLAGDLLSYVPRPGETTAAVDVRWPRMPTLLQVAGDPALGQWVDHVQIKGVAFAFTGVPASMLGWVDNQAAVDVGAAVEVDGARSFRLIDCKVQHTGGYAVWLRRGVKNAEIKACVMDDLGAGGIKVGEKVPNVGPLSTDAARILDNRITRTGREFPGAIGIWVGHSSGNEINGNVIAHTSYSGISVGWQWGFAPPTATNNRVAGNVLIDIGQGQMSDMGGIYTLGRSPGTVIEGNFIRHVTAYAGYGPGAWGIYNDEGTSDVLVKGNVVIDAQAGAYHLHYGRDNDVVGNLFALGSAAEVRWTAPDKSGKWQLRQNVIAPRTPRWLDVGPGDGSRLVPEGNEFGASAGGSVAVTAGPGAADVAVSGVSPGGAAAAWAAVVQQARQRVRDMTLAQAPARAARPHPGTWGMDLTHTVLGGRPIDVRTSPRDGQGAVRVVDDGGARALALHDGDPGLALYDPHMYIPLEIDSGNVTVSFAIKIDPGAVLVHEWRDATAKYNTGPRLQISAEGLRLGGTKLVPVPVGTWLEVEVTQDLSSTTGQWTARWRPQLAGASWQRLGPFAPHGPQAPRRWRWVGWYSNGKAPATTLLRAVEVKRNQVADRPFPDPFR